MPALECGFSGGQGGLGRNYLVQHGPTVKVLVGFDPAYSPGGGLHPNLSHEVLALIDTGATISCIDALLAKDLGLVETDRTTVSGSSGSHEVPAYLAHVHVPQLGFTQWGQFLGVGLADGGQAHHVLIGRSFLADFSMTYNGTTGRVVLSR